MEPPSGINPPGSGPVNPPGLEGVKMEPADHPGGCTSNYFPCEWCNKTFTSSPSYKRHIWYHKQSFECKKCPMVFTKFQDMKLHQTVHQCGKKKTAEDQEHNHECQICGKRFKSLAWFETHMENHKLPEAEETLLFCNLCNLSFCQKSKYKLHLESHQEGERKIFKCRKCHKTLPSRTAYKSHLRTHLKKRFRCQGHCDKTFSTKQLLLNHLSNGINDNRICDKCGKIFINLQALHKHKENHKKAVSNSFYCEKCNSKFSHQRSFEFHILRVHTDTFEKNNYSNQCRICQKVFSAKHTLAYHMLMHTEPRCFKCDQCSFSSKIKEVLDQHLQHHEQNDYEDSEEDIHSKPEAEQQERLEEEVDMLLPQEYLDQSMEEQNSVIELDGLGKNGFACDQCPRKFKKQYLLDNHLKVHKGGKFFTCIQCHGTFAFMNLGLHKNMCFPCYGNSLDLSDTNLACTQCPRTFPSKFHLLMHLKIHNTGKFLKCEYCDGCFPKNKNCKGAHKDCPVRKAKLEEVKLEIEEPYELEESDGLLLIKKEVPYEAEEGFKYKPFSQTMRPYMDPREEEKEKLEDLSGVQLEDLLPMDKDKKDNLEVFDVIDLDTYSNDLIGMGFTVKSEEETFGNVEKQEDIEDLMNDLQEIVSGNDGLEDPADAMPSVDVATEPKPSSTTLYKSDDELKHNDAEKDSDEESFHLLLDGDDPPDSPKPKTNCDSDANSTSREESKTVDGAENTKTTEAEITADWRKAPPVIIPPKDQDKRKSTEDDLLDISIIRDADEDNASAIAEEKDSQISEAESSDADAPPEAEPEPETEPEPNPDPNDPKPTETENDIEVEVEPDPPQEPGKGEKETTKRGIEEVEAEAPDTNKKIKLEKVDIKQEPKSEVLNALGSFAHYMLSKKMKDLLTISDLEQFVAQKFVEAIRHKTELGELHQTIKKQEYSIETLRKEVLQLAKQNRDLEIVNRKLMTELRAQNGSKKPLVPLKITRSVGLQVKMNLQEVGKRKPGSLGKAASPIVKKTSPQPIAPNLTKKASPLKPAAPLLSQALRTQNRASPSKKTGSKPKPGNFIDLTDEDDKNVKNQNQIKLTYNTINTVQLGNKTLPVVNQMKNRTVALPGVRLASPMKNGKLTIPASVVSTAANGGALMYVVPNTVIASSQLIKFQPNGLLNGPINGSPLTLAPKGSTIQFKQVGSGGRLLAPLVHPAPLPAPPVNASNPHLKPIPPKPHLSIRKTDTGIILQWKMPYDLDMYETIASYQLYAYQETNATPSTDMWRRVGDVKALALPMACTLTQFADKNKYYFAVRSVDVHKRIGAFSDPEEISL